MSYCNGDCEYLDEKKHKCNLTGEKLTHMKYSGSISFEVHEHSGFCEQEAQNDRAGSNRLLNGR